MAATAKSAVALNPATMKVEDLRVELAARNLSTGGLKPTLVRRLAAALRKEEKDKAAAVVNDGDAVVADNGGSVAAGRKRKRANDEEEDAAKDADKDGDGNGDANGCSNEVDKLEAMGFKELRALAKERGVGANGGKKDIIVRLVAASASAGPSSDDKVDKKDGADDIKKSDKEAKEKLVTATKKGAAVMDPHIPAHIRASHHVLQVGDEIYDATLNQTNVGDNNNKFYMVQVLESDNASSYLVYNRWGRVGVPGQSKMHGPFLNRQRAIDEFTGKFYDKSNNLWQNRKNFKCYPKKYTWLEMDYGEAEKDSDNGKKKSIEDALNETKLERRTANFVSLICNINMMKQQMVEIGYNADKLPLGKLSKSTILKGYDVLKRISEVILRDDRRLLEQLSGEFYTVIPHDFGFKHMSQFIIDTPQKLKAKLEMVEALGEIEIATKLLEEDASSSQDDPIYSRYKHLQCDLSPVEVDSEDYSMIEKYLKNTHGKTHSGYTVDIVQIFKVVRLGEPERFKKFSETDNRMLLWHGSRLTNWTGILSQGLRIAPPEAPSTGYMFGKGVYFADMFSKSANYCYASSASSSGVLLLCEVALGEMNELINANYNANKLPKGKLSTKGLGRTTPDMSEALTLEDGVIVPLGSPKDDDSERRCLQYNEYIVYDVDQIRMRYVLQVNFNFNYKW